VGCPLPIVFSTSGKSELTPARTFDCLCRMRDQPMVRLALEVSRFPRRDRERIARGVADGAVILVTTA
jgi:hypothetical protein